MLKSEGANGPFPICYMKYSVNIAWKSYCKTSLIKLALSGYNTTYSSEIAVVVFLTLFCFTKSKSLTFWATHGTSCCRQQTKFLYSTCSVNDSFSRSSSACRPLSCSFSNFSLSKSSWCMEVCNFNISFSSVTFDELLT